MSETIIGLFNQSEQAQEVVPLLLGQGFNQSDIDLIGDQNAARSDGSDLTAMLSSFGVADAQQQCYVDGLRRGGILVAARTDDGSRADAAAALMREHGASDCAHGATDDAARQNMGQNIGGTIPVVEEELRVGKREVETGGVRVHKNVTERPVEAEVELRQERVTAERHPTDRPLSAADRDRAFKDETIEVTEKSEQPTVQKAARVVEEVEINKEVEQHTESVRDNVRRTDVDVEKLDPDGKKRRT